MQRRIEQTDGHSVTVHSLEDTLEVSALHREKLGESHATAFDIA